MKSGMVLLSVHITHTQCVPICSVRFAIYIYDRFMHFKMLFTFSFYQKYAFTFSIHQNYAKLENLFADSFHFYLS